VDLGRILVGLIFLAGVVFLINGFFKDVKENTPPPIKYILKADMRVSPDKSSLVAKNLNDFAWPNPLFLINSSYNLKYEGFIRAGETVALPFNTFHNDTGAAFPGISESQGYRFDIQTATMSWK
jgi:hypothetical protein